MSAVNDRHLTIRALEMAIKRRCPDAGCCTTRARAALPENAEGIIQEHLLGNGVMENLCFAKNPLG